MMLLSMVSNGNRIARVRTYGAAGYMIELTELKRSARDGGEVYKRHFTWFYKRRSNSMRDAQQWVDLATE